MFHNVSANATVVSKDSTDDESPTTKASMDRAIEVIPSTPMKVYLDLLAMHALQLSTETNFFVPFPYPQCYSQKSHAWTVHIHLSEPKTIINYPHAKC